MKPNTRKTASAASFRKASKDIDGVIDLIRRAVYFEHVVVAASDSGERGRGPWTILHSDWPRDLHERYVAERWGEDDPAALALASRRPVIRPAAVVAAAEGNGRATAFLKILAEFEVPPPTVFPVFHLQNVVGAVCFSRNKPFAEAETALLEMITPPLHRQLAEELRADLDDGVQLTAREVECLRHASKGMTSEEIANVMPLAAATITAQLRSAAAKLGAANRTSSIAEAIRRGIIE